MMRQKYHVHGSIVMEWWAGRYKSWHKLLSLKPYSFICIGLAFPFFWCLELGRAVCRHLLLPLPSCAVRHWLYSQARYQLPEPAVPLVLSWISMARLVPWGILESEVLNIMIEYYRKKKQYAAWNNANTRPIQGVYLVAQGNVMA